MYGQELTRAQKNSDQILVVFGLALSLFLDSLVLQYLYNTFIPPNFVFMPSIDLAACAGIILIAKLLTGEKSIASNEKQKKNMLFFNKNKLNYFFSIVFWPAATFAVAWLINNLHHIK
jgi:hypothetical protein